MLIWSAVLFFLGLLAFIDAVFNMGEIFRQVNSILYLLLSLALLIRTSMKARERRLEKYQQKVFSLEQEVASLKKAQKELIES